MALPDPPLRGEKGKKKENEKASPDTIPRIRKGKFGYKRDKRLRFSRAVKKRKGKEKEKDNRKARPKRMKKKEKSRKQGR